MKKVRIGFLIILGLLCLTLPMECGAAETADVEKNPIMPSEKAEDIQKQTLGGNELFDLGSIESGVVDDLIRRVAEEKLFTDIANQLNKSSKKLGYLIGDTLEVELDKSLFELSSLSLTNFPITGAESKKFKGSIKLTNFTIKTGSSTSVELVKHQDSGNVIVTFTRVQHAVNQGAVVFEGDVSCDITYYDGDNWLNPNRGKYVTSNVPTNEIKEIITVTATTIDDLPKLKAELNGERRVLTIGEEPEVSDMLKYFTILTSAGEVKVSYVTKPDTSKIGSTEATMLLVDIYNQHFEITIPLIIVDHLIATPVKQENILLGTPVKDLPFDQWVTNVKLEKSNIDLTLGNVGELNTYQVSLKHPEQVIDKIGLQTVPVVVTAGEASAEFLIPVTAEIGTSLFVNNSASQTVFGLSLLPKGGDSYQLSGSKGRSSESGLVTTPIDLAIARATSPSVMLDELEWQTEYSFATEEDILSSYKKISAQTVKVGDVIRLTNHGIGQINRPFDIYYKGSSVAFETPSPLIERTIYFVVTETGFEPLQVNQLQVSNDNSLELYQTEAEIASQLEQYIQNTYQDKGVNVLGFGTYPSTQEPGETVGRIEVSQAKGNHGYQYSYRVKATVKEGALIFSVPTDFNFGTHTLGSVPKTIQRISSSNDTVTVVDNRLASEKSKWSLGAKITNTADELGKYTVYVDQQGDTHYFKNGQSIPVLQSTSVNQPGKIISTQIWDKTEGILLKIPKQHELEVKTYQTEIEWTVTLGGEL